MSVKIGITFSLTAVRTYQVWVSYPMDLDVKWFKLVQKPETKQNLSIIENESLMTIENGAKTKYFEINRNDLKLLVMNGTTVQMILIGAGTEFPSQELDLAEYFKGERI